LKRPFDREALYGYTFIAPAVLIILLFAILPVIAAFFLSFTRYDIITLPQWIGLTNYRRLLNDALFFKSLSNTLYYALGVIPVGMAFSLILALTLNRVLRGISFFRAAYYLPVVTSLVAVSMIWLWIYSPADYGLLNYLLSSATHLIQSIGKLCGVDTLARIDFLRRSWLGDPTLAMPAIIVMSIWKGLGYNMVIYLAGLQSIPEELYEAATIDGAGRWEKFRDVTWPLLKPTTFFIIVTSIIGASQVFGQVYVMTNGGPNNTTTTIVHQIFQNAFSFLRMGYAAAMAFVLFLIIFAISMLNWRFFKVES
jgi:multiple sugar transport system permease protein